jgi:MoaA/NifB/PqqE/SkfB family radical SAM enzyme
VRYPRNYTSIHIELTDKCQASCPMCARNYNGGAERPFVGQSEITLEDFKRWVDVEILENLYYFYACGNYGDPIIAKDCLEIFRYVRENSDTRLSIHTNGGARNTKWWHDLADAMRGDHEVTFGIDGFADSHVLYRRGTDYNKIIDNAKAFIDNGGYATVDTLIFKHNEDEAKAFEEEMLRIGFKSVNFKSTQRFYDMDKFPVQDTKGNLEYYLEPPTKEPFKRMNFLKLEDISKDISIWENIVATTNVDPKCMNKNEIYIDSRGNVLPCCWVGSDMLEEPLDVSLTIHNLRNKLVDNTKEHFGKFTGLNLNDLPLDYILESEAWALLHDKDIKPWICTKNCSA